MIALVLGGADCLFDDLAALAQLLGTPMTADQARQGVPWPGVVLAVNEAAIHYGGRIDHWCSLHPNKFGKWKSERGAWNGAPPVTWAHGDPAVAQYADRQAHLEVGGSSGLFAGWEVATLALGCDAVVYCGTPMDKRPHIGRAGDWAHFSGFRANWELLHAAGKLAHMRSLSGWSRDLVGAPTSEWLGSLTRRTA